MSQNTASKRSKSLRVERKREQARQEILEAAQSILLEGGPDSVTLASVAGNLGMTKQALYHYFVSKEALLRALVTTLVDNEIETLVAAIEAVDSGEETLGTLIKAFYGHYIGRLDAFRSVYCQSQLYSGASLTVDEGTVREEINPRTRHLFDVLQERLSSGSQSAARQERMRQLAFTAWLSALGLITMIGVADAVDDPLVHSDEDLLATLCSVFNDATKNIA